ncbi:MAG: hypothetical protein MZU95_06595 [Desulfomicrobium escambiense]|nr:hypothetical protein [Desulfomicrobium escambiense]
MRRTIRDPPRRRRGASPFSPAAAASPARRLLLQLAGRHARAARRGARLPGPAQVRQEVLDRRGQLFHLGIRQDPEDGHVRPHRQALRQGRPARLRPRDHGPLRHALHARRPRLRRGRLQDEQGRRLPPARQRRHARRLGGPADLLPQRHRHLPGPHRVRCLSRAIRRRSFRAAARRDRRERFRRGLPVRPVSPPGPAGPGHAPLPRAPGGRRVFDRGATASSSSRSCPTTPCRSRASASTSSGGSPGRTRDIGVLAVQARLAYDQEGEHKLEPQLYNAYFRLKTKFAGIWIGHSRPALGLSSVLDGHALLLPAPAMLGYGFDRDWGSGSSGISAGAAPPPR